VDRLSGRVERHEGLVEGAVGVSAVAALSIADVGGRKAAVVAVQTAIGVGERASLVSTPSGQAELDAIVISDRLGIRRTAITVRHHLIYAEARIGYVIHLPVLSDGACVLDRPVKALAGITCL